MGSDREGLGREDFGNTVHLGYTKLTKQHAIKSNTKKAMRSRDSVNVDARGCCPRNTTCCFTANVYFISRRVFKRMGQGGHNREASEAGGSQGL